MKKKTEKKLFKFLSDCIKDYEKGKRKPVDVTDIKMILDGEKELYCKCIGDNLIIEAGNEMSSTIKEKAKIITEKTFDNHLKELKKELKKIVKQIGFHKVADYGISKGTLSRLVNNEDLKIETLFKIQYLIDKNKKKD